MSIFKELIDYSNSKSEYETKSFKEYRSKLRDKENKKLNFAYYQTPDVVLIRNKNPHIKMEELSYKLQDKKGKKM